MPLVHVCTDQQPHVWRRLGANAKLSGVPLRDFLTYLIVNSAPVPDGDQDARATLLAVVRSNREARRPLAARTWVDAANSPSAPADEDNQVNESAAAVARALQSDRSDPAPGTRPRRTLTAAELLDRYFADQCHPTT